MNDGLKEKLHGQGKLVGDSILRHKTAKAALATFDAHSRTAVKADGVKRTEADTDAAVLTTANRVSVEQAAIVAEAEMEATKTDTACLLAEVSLVCSETAAMSRISQ